MGPLGVPELLVILGVVVFRLIPVAAVMWALVALYNVRAEQRAMAGKLDTLERLLRESGRA
jgi:hypothetical protein